MVVNTRWVLGTKPGSSAKAASALNHGAHSPAPKYAFLNAAEPHAPATIPKHQHNPLSLRRHSRLSGAASAVGVN